jgi:hypothetical protein
VAQTLQVNNPMPAKLTIRQAIANGAGATADALNMVEHSISPATATRRPMMLPL